MAYEKLGDGLWYFHIKAKRQGIFGGTTHFLLRIDTTSPASFKPKAELLTAAVVGRTIISFFTTDALSGMDHYEVGLIDKESALTQSPVFVQTESPYQVPSLASGSVRVIVRAFDRAGNIKDESVDTYNSFAFLRMNFMYVIIFIIVFFIIVHYLFGHRIISKLKKIIGLLKKEEDLEKKEQMNGNPNNSNSNDGNTLR
jgi:hypothetical protein